VLAVVVLVAGARVFFSVVGALTFSISRSRATTILISLSFNGVPDNANAAGTHAFGTVTKPNPRERPLKRPNLLLTISISTGAQPIPAVKYSFNCSELTSKCKLFTYN
jgi:hypothetical protein